MYVHRVKAPDVLSVLNPKHVEPVLEQEWKQFKRDPSFFVPPVERVMDGVRRLRSPVTNVRAKAEQYRRSTLRFLFLPVGHQDQRESNKKNVHFSL